MHSPQLEKQEKQEKQVEELTRLVADLFAVDASYLQKDQIVLSLRYRFDRAKSETLLKDRLSLSGYKFSLSSSADSLLVTVQPRRKLTIPRLNIFLFLLTLASVYLVPVYQRYVIYPSSLESALAAAQAALARGAGLEFTVALMSILLVHEMAHFIASRRRGIITSWPYFIPAPNIIGTFGAVIKAKSPFWNRRDLIEVGAAGPIAGWIVALVWLILGMAQTEIVSTEFLVPGDLPWTLDGESILVKCLVPWLVGTPGPGEVLRLTEAAFAGWVGLLITAINMLPIGQLDGGHVLYGLVTRRQASLGWLALGVLLILGFQSLMWWLFAAIGFIMGVAHPKTLNDSQPLTSAAKMMGWVSLIILLLSFTPVPFAVSLFD